RSMSTDGGETMVSSWTPPARRLGYWSALSVALVGGAYVLTGVIWLVVAGFRSPEPLQPSEPFLSILELLILLSVPALVALMAAVHAYAPHEPKAAAQAALAFMSMFATPTGEI